MKAIINGVTLYGTPEEILEYQDLHKKRNEKKASDKLNVNVKINPKDIIDATKTSSVIYEVTGKNPYTVTL